MTSRPIRAAAAPDPGAARLVPVRDIRLDSAYQRDLETDRVQKLLREWDPRLTGVLVLSARAGSLWCIDGQHRLAAMRERGELYCNALVIEGLSQIEEAHLFVVYNRNRKGLNAWDLFKAESAAGHEDVLNVIRIVHSHGFRVDRTGGTNHIGAVSAIRRIYKLGAEPLLALTLDTVRQTWSGDKKALDGQMLEGLAVFFHSFRGEPQYDQARAGRTLQANPPVKFLRRAQEIATRRMAASSNSTNVAEAVRDIYNVGLGTAKRLGTVRRYRKSPRRPTADET